MVLTQSLEMVAPLVQSYRVVSRTEYVPVIHQVHRRMMLVLLGKVI